MHGDGNGWSFSPDGSRRWGLHGAAGLLLRCPLPNGEPAVLLQHRAVWSHQGGTWALPGGARDSHETETEAALREAHEEAGIPVESVRIRAEVVTANLADVWTYTTVVADTHAAAELVANAESLELRWVPEDDVDLLPLHPGFAAAWPALRVNVILDGEGGELPRVEHRDEGFVWLRDPAARAENRTSSL